jgi:hypothetical protein
MKTTERVRQLGLYVSACCNDELLFDVDDICPRCLQCEMPCSWKLVEEVISWQELGALETQAA